MIKKTNFVYLVLFIIAGPSLVFSIPSINSVIENRDPVGQYDKFELTVNLTANYSNPYDPDPSSGGLDLWAIFTSPSGVTKRVNGFYMDTNNDGYGDSWKIRFATGETGNWIYTIYARDNTGQSSSSQYSFSVTQSTNKGFIRPSTINPRFFVYENGGNFWGIGHNNGWQNWQNVENPNMATMASYGENVLVFWSNTPWENNPSRDRERMPMEYAGSGTNYWQWNGYFIDNRLANAEANGIKIILCLWTHDNLKDSGGAWWNMEYKNLCSSSDFFDNAASLARQQKYYRYAIARWGYSRALFMWDLIVEASLTDGWKNKGASVVENWLQNVVNYFKSNDPFGHPLTASLHGGWDQDNSDLKWPNGWAKTGVSQIHSYAWKDDMTKSPIEIAHNTKYMWQILNQPNFIGEFGTSNSSNQPTSIHRGVWAALATGASCSPMLWCDGGSWKFMDTNMLNSQKYVAQFVSDIDFENMITEQKSVTVTGYYAWGVGSPEYAIAWMFNPSGNIGTGKTMVISSFNDASYRVLWYNTWTGATVSTVDVSSSGGVINVAVPQVGYPDIACKITKIGPTATFTPTSTITNTRTNTATNTITHTGTNTATFTNTNTPGGPTYTYTPTNTNTATRTNTPTVTNTTSPLPDTAKYNFEDGTMQGWYLDTANGQQGVNALNSSDYAIGMRSVRLQVNFAGGGLIWHQGAIAHDNQAPVGIVKVKVYVPAGVSAALRAKIYLQDSSWQWRESALVDLTVNNWTDIIWDLSQVVYGNPVNRIGIMIGSNDSYNGYIYIDSIDYLEQGEPTRTFTNTPANTLTFTNTQTFTQTNTPTSTVTSTRTNTITNTATNTGTSTATNTATNTPSPTVTVTGTQPATWTNTNTLTNTSSHTPSFTSTTIVTYTETPTFTQTSTNTATQVLTATNTSTNTLTLTPSYTVTLTFTQTNTGSNTATFTHTQLLTFTPTLTPVLTFIPTATENLEIINDSIIIYPQPYYGKGEVYIKFRITKNAKEIKIRIYTSGFRLVREFKQEKQFITGENELKITEIIKPLANGIYYFTIELNDGKGQIKSKINEIIIIK